jgi:hypothetical protein
MLIHSVYFWFKPSTEAAVLGRFAGELERLGALPQVTSSYVGVPEATTKRPVIDDSYSWALILIFADIAAHDAYQQHPVHEAFVEEFRSSWDRVQVYDVRA